MGQLEIPDGSVILPDSSCLIYLVEAVPPYVDLLRPVFERVRQGRIQAVVSTLAIAEVLVRPLRLGETEVAAGFRRVLVHARNTRLVPVTVALAERAAHLRATYGLRTPDAVHVASALATQCTHILTNNTTWNRITEVPVVVLDDFVEAEPAGSSP